MKDKGDARDEGNGLFLCYGRHTVVGHQISQERLSETAFSLTANNADGT